MKKLLLITMLLCSGLVHAAENMTKQELLKEFNVALKNADASKVSECIAQDPSLATEEEKWYTDDSETTTRNQFQIVLESTAEVNARIATLEVLINKDYPVTTKDLQRCFDVKQQEILVALTKMVKIPQNNKLVKAIINVNATQEGFAHFIVEFKQELIQNLIGVYPGLLEQEYLIEELLTLNDKAYDPFIHDLVNQGAVVSSSAKKVIPTNIKDNEDKEIPNPRANLLIKDVDQATKSIAQTTISPELIGGIGLFALIGLCIKFRKEIKAFFFEFDDEEITEELSKA